MKKILAFVLLASLIGLGLVSVPVEACDKTVTPFADYGDGDMILEVGEEFQWIVVITIANQPWVPGWDGVHAFQNVVVTDNLNAELEVDNLPYPPHASQGTWTIEPWKGGKTKITWYAGSVAPGDVAYFMFFISTDINPGGKHEYTTPGTYYLNSGPTMKYRVQGKQFSLELNSVMVTVYGVEGE